MPVNTLGFQNAVGEIAVATRRRTGEVEARERFLRRLDGYRKHHVNSLNQFDNYMNSVYEQQRQDTRLLHQNWIDSRSKKVVKSKLARHGQNNANSSVAQKLLRQKLAVQSQSPSVSAVNGVFKTSSPLPMTSQESSIETSSAPFDSSEPQHSVQVSINLGAGSLQLQQNEITVKFSSTVQPHEASDSRAISSSSSAATMESCKSEMKDVQHGFALMPEQSPVSGTETIDIDDFDGFSDFCSIDEDFIKSFEFENDYSQENKLPISSNDLFTSEETVIAKQGVVSCNSDLMPSAYMDSGFGAGIGASGDEAVATTLQGTAPVTPMARLPLEPCPAGAAPPTPALLGDTGPAAETLKQMAAQHQNQENVLYVANANRFDQDAFPGRYLSSASCYRDTSFMQREYGPVFMNNLPIVSQLDSRMLQQHRTVSGNTPQLQPPSELSSAYYPQGQAQHFAERVIVPSSLQQLEHQVHSHFDSQEHCASTPSHMAPASLQNPSVHPGASEPQFHLSQRSQMRNQASQEHLSMMQCQQLMNTNTGCHAYSVVDGDAAERVRVHHLYQSQQQQQQQQQCYNPYGNGMPYQLHSSVQLHPVYRNVPLNNRNRFAAVAQQHPENVICQMTDPLMIDQMRYDGFSAPKPTSAYMSNAQMMQLANSQGSSIMSNMDPYCQPRINNVQLQNVVMKTNTPGVAVRPSGLNAMGPDQCASTNWSNLGQQQQHLGHQYGASSNPMSRCRSGGNGVLPSYDEHKYQFQQQKVSASHNPCSAVYGDQGLAQCLNHIWTPSAPLSSGGPPKIHQIHQQNSGQLHHHGMGMMGPNTMHATDDASLPSHLCLPLSCSGLSAHSQPTTDSLHATQCQNFEFLGSLEAAVSSGHELLSQNILDNLPSIY